MFEKIIMTIGITTMIGVLLLITVPFIGIGIELIYADRIFIGILLIILIILIILTIIAGMFSILENLFED